jgi:hypothetical protein
VPDLMVADHGFRAILKMRGCRFVIPAGKAVFSQLRRNPGMHLLSSARSHFLWTEKPGLTWSAARNEAKTPQFGQTGDRCPWVPRQNVGMAPRKTFRSVEAQGPAG